MKKVVLLALCLPGSLCAMQDISLQDLIANTAKENGWYIYWIDAKNDPENPYYYVFEHVCKLVEKNDSLSTFLYELEYENDDEMWRKFFLENNILKVNDCCFKDCGLYNKAIFFMLHTIKLENNELTSFPYELFLLPLLKNLDLWNNNISYVSNSFYVQELCRQHKHLEEIRLSGNDLREFPSALLLLPNLQN